MRLIVIISTYAFFWMIVPLGFKLQVPGIGDQWYSFPAIHAIGSLMFFLYFILILLFGKRIDCGWCCPCVTARETIGYPFRDKTPRNRALVAPALAEIRAAGAAGGVSWAA